MPQETGVSAKEYVEAMWRMLQQEVPGDFILASGTRTSILDFARAACAAAGFEISFEESLENEVGVDRSNGDVLIRIDPTFFRPVESHQLCGNPDKAFQTFGWKAKTPADELASLMVKADLEKTSGKDMIN